MGLFCFNVLKRIEILLKNLLTVRALRFPGVSNIYNCFDESEQAYWREYIYRLMFLTHTCTRILVKKKKERDFYLKYNCFF